MSGMFVDHEEKKKSRYCAREVATYKDPTVFAAASDVDDASMLDLFAVKKGYSTTCFDAAAAFSQAEEQELIFLEPPAEYLERIGRRVLWQCLRVREGRRNGARCWQEHFCSVLTSSECPGRFAQNPKAPPMYFSRSLDILIDLHVDDGYVAGPKEKQEELYRFLEKHVAIKVSPLVEAGVGFDHVGATRMRTESGMWIKPFDKYTERALDLMGMVSCNTSSCPKLDKQHLEGDENDLEESSVYRSAVCTLLYLAQRRPEMQSNTVRWLCKRLTKPNLQSDRQLKKLLRYLKCSADLATLFPTASEDMVIKGFVDGDWGCDDLDRKSVSGIVVMVGGCRIHCHSRTTPSHALSSGECEVMSMSELLNDCLYIQFCLELCGMGILPIGMLTDASVARQFVHRKGVGRMKHIDIRYMWLQAATWCTL